MDGGGNGWGLVLSFGGIYPTREEEHAFVQGFEMGCLDALMNGGTVAEIERTMHTANRAMVERAAAAYGWSLEITPCMDGAGNDVPDYIMIKMSKTTAARPNPHGLRVVK